MRRLVIVCALVTATLGLASCGVERTGPPRVGDPAPDVHGATLAADSLSLADLEGSPVLLNLWATWCPPCRAEMPYLQELHERYGPAGLRVVGVTVDNAAARDQVEAFIAESGVDYDILLDPRGTSMDLYQVIGLPATFLLDREGVIRLNRLGPVSESDTTFTLGIEALLER